MINIINASFLNSAPSLASCPDFGLSEVAFLGRSNVGKSSLINALCSQKGLAKSSSTPGKTQLINFFSVEFQKNQSLENELVKTKAKAVFVDLPGFGYAKVSKSMKDSWQRNLSEFLKQRTYIRAFVHLVDSRHGDLESDELLSEFLSSFVRADQRVLKVFTKADKLNQSQKSKLKGGILVSSAKGTGIDKLKTELYNAVFG